MIGAVWLGETWREPTAFIFGIFAFQVLVVVGVGFLSWFWVLSVYPAADMAVYSFLAPVFGVVFGYLILNETIGFNVSVALVLVSIGIALVNFRPKVNQQPGIQSAKEATKEATSGLRNNK